MNGTRRLKLLQKNLNNTSPNNFANILEIARSYQQELRELFNSFISMAPII